MIKVKGNIVEKPISVIVDLGYTHGYVTPKIVERT